MKDELTRRLEALEELHKEDPLYIKVSNSETLEEKIVTVDEFLQMPEAFYMVNVVSGSSLKDLDKILNNIRENALKEGVERRQNG